ncbi:site-2 protease family protein [Patescibacteria group bacterium]|nr:site-2 protease family protein [Patescibacteria group bacterium]MBU1016315.1 site-2 protease family protein [Patescibacteria group bacterium]
MDIIYLLIALAVCVTVHEAAHAWVAFKLGDPTAKMEGRVSLNPMKHLDILGTIMIFIAHFGWGKPVPFNYNNLKHPRRDAALISVAGPMTNLLTAVVIAIMFKYLPLPGLVSEILRAIYSLSLILFLFNLIPIAPLDGSKLIGLLIPRSREDWYQRFLSQGPVYIILLIIADRLIAEVSGFSFFGTYLQFGYDLITAGIMIAT